MVNVGTHNTIDAQRHEGGALPCLSGMGVDGTHNTVGKISAPTTLFGSVMLGRSQGTVLQVYRVRSLVLRLT